MLSDHWPLFDLKIRTPRLELRYPTDDDLALLVELTREEIHERDFMPFLTPWTRAESPERERNALRFWWRLRATADVDEWVLPFLVLDRGEPVGVQDLKGVVFPITRSVVTGSWLVRRHQGRGIGNRRLGYVSNGSQIDAREGQPVKHLRFVLTRDEWARHRRDDIHVEGLEGTAEFLGIKQLP